ncbi:hypothetical protein MIMGU_mgv1a024926mg [Erythranthe guttata]|uniref:RING-type E3 ubiquitin transferase n=1 Tax=Erythranthe guttata TaxID=4155 RepID=A0A022RM79_ERYGU|nr:hypothetical protein MIMGU_mgv1a024926mg [Erythranthe guttata]
MDHQQRPGQANFRGDHHTRRRSDGLSEDQIAKCLKIKSINSCPDNYNNIRDLEEREVCAVCLDALCQKNNNIGVLECKHEYHSDCIKKWLRVKNFCPMCKSVVFN